ncbi:MAG: ACT domain-containing protein [Verrucomicrobia bacterium]|nr:ACT domain-containing protein [Verrucomicrobiota bacterium]
MQIPLVMTVLGADRPGLVELVARIVAEHGGNWLESRMCRLGGEFAGILRVHVPAERAVALEQALAGLGAQGLQALVRPDRSRTARPEQEQGLATIEFVGQDRPGIVRQISGVLAQHRVNVEELATECTSAPMSGEHLFKAKATLHLPEACDVAALRAELELIAADLLVDISLEPLSVGAGLGGGAAAG